MRVLLRVALALSVLMGIPAPSAAQDGVVHAVLFYSPSCPHCHVVINQDLPPLQERFGDQFQVVGVDVTTQGGQQLYQATVEYFALPDSRLGVPAMVVGLSVMVGSEEIPDRLPGIIERGIAGGGIDWPPVEAIRNVLAAQGLIQETREPPTPDPAPAEVEGAAAERPAPEAATTDTGPAAAETPTGPSERGTRPGPATTRTPENSAPSVPDTAPENGLTTQLSGTALGDGHPMGVGQAFLQDPVGNSVAVAALFLLVAVMGWSVLTVLRPSMTAPQLPSWLFALLTVAGAGIAAYLSFVEVTGAQAVCGPVGDCNTVQQSAYAHLFGVLPVGVLGLAGYVGILASWAAARRGSARVAVAARATLWGMAWVGTAFSAYLTFLEPFVIGATCAWCVSSALVMAVLLVGATGELTGPQVRPA